MEPHAPPVPPGFTKETWGKGIKTARWWAHWLTRRGVDADDALQTMWIALIKAARRYRPDHPNAAWRTYVAVTCRTSAFLLLGRDPQFGPRDGPRVTRVDVDLTNEPAHSADPELLTQRAESALIAREAVRQVAAYDKSDVAAWLKDATLREIADRTGVSRQRVAQRRAVTLQKIRDIIGEDPR